MKTCKKCGTKNVDDEIFCTNCGANLMTREYIDNDNSDEVKTNKPIDNKQDTVKKDNNKKKSPKVKIGIIAGVSVAVIGIIVVVLFFLLNGNVEKPTNEEIIKDLNSISEITNFDVNKKPYEFQVKELEIKNEIENSEDNTYSFDGRLIRENDVYGIEAGDYKVVYVKEGREYKLKSAKAVSDEITFYPVGGIEQEVATKKIQKSYPKAEYDSRKTDLEKGTDKVIYKVDSDDYSGSVYIVYKFDNKKGWLYKGINDKNIEFKKGVTHIEDGLYTNSNVKNILFLGVDSDSGVGRSDCMMLISVDSNTGTIKQTSFMRDNFFEIPGYGSNKLNAAYAFGGPELTLKTIQQTFKIKIDNYVVVDFSTFKAVINALGGVNVNITSDEAGYINWQINKNGQAGSVGTVSTAGGVTHLNGQQALWLCRDRGGNGFSGNDFTRTGRQRRVIQSLVTTYSNYTPDKVLATIRAIKSNVKTNLTSDDFKWYAERSGKFFSYKFKERCVPDDGEWQSGYSGGGAWIIQINDFGKLKSDIQKFIYEDIK